MLLALWLYATMEGVGAARALDRLCDYHAAYRWLCGGVPVNHNLLSEFRREGGALLDRVLTQSVTGLIAEGIITPEESAIDVPRFGHAPGAVRWRRESGWRRSRRRWRSGSRR